MEYSVPVIWSKNIEQIEIMTRWSQIKVERLSKPLEISSFGTSKYLVDFMPMHLIFSWRIDQTRFVDVPEKSLNAPK